MSTSNLQASKGAVDKSTAETYAACLQIATKAGLRPETRGVELPASVLCGQLKTLVQQGAETQQLERAAEQIRAEQATIRVSGPDGILAKTAALEQSRKTLEHILENKKLLLSKLTTANTGRTVVVEVGLQQEFRQLLEDICADIVRIDKDCEDLKWGAEFQLGPHVWENLLDPVKQALLTQRQLFQSMKANREETIQLHRSGHAATSGGTDGVV